MPSMTDPQLDAVERWTGMRPASCPWNALRDPFVGRVLAAHRHYEKGQLHVFHQNISSRLARGVQFYAQIFENVSAQRDEELRKQQREQERH